MLTNKTVTYLKKIESDSNGIISFREVLVRGIILDKIRKNQQDYYVVKNNSTNMIDLIDPEHIREVL